MSENHYAKDEEVKYSIYGAAAGVGKAVTLQEDDDK